MSTTYELRVQGHLDAHWSPRLGGLDVHHEPDGTSTLTGPLVDQAPLHGVLASLRDVGASLLSLHVAPDDEDSPGAPGPALSRVSWPQVTDRLALRPARPEDADATWAFRHQQEVSRWLTELPTSRADYRAAFEQPDRLSTTLIIDLDGKVIGDLMLRVEDAWAQAEVAERGTAMQAELGWVLNPDHTGQGYATEAVRELVRICFEVLRVHRVVATCFADNDPSWRLMERLGLRRELHAVADAWHRSGRWMDTYGYAITAEEWRARSA
jgi:RimJ/RimL family protein N-acetyltransferase